RVLDGRDRRARRPQALVQAPRDPHVLQPQVAETGIGVALDELGGLVRGAVVDDDQLEVLDGLGEHRLDRLPQRPGVVPAADQDADAWRVRAVSLHPAILVADPSTKRTPAPPIAP